MTAALERAARTIVGWKQNPRSFFYEELKFESGDPWLDEFIDALPSRDPAKRQVFLRACTGAGKSAALAGANLWFIATHGGTEGNHPKGVILSIDKANLDGNIWAELSKWQSRSEYLKGAFVWTATKFYAKEHQATWWLEARSWGKKADKEAQGRALSGLHAPYVLATLDECGDMPVSLLRVAQQIFSSKHTYAKILGGGNPTSLDGVLYQTSVNEREQTHSIAITADPEDPRRGKRTDIDNARAQIAKYGRTNPWVMATILGQFPPASINALLGIEEVEMAMRRVIRPEAFMWAEKRIGVDCARFGDDRCHDAETEVLTDQGWKLFPDLSGSERVLSLVGDTATWQPITEVVSYPFDGELNLQEGRAANFCVTDSHRFPVRTGATSDAYSLRAFRDLPDNYFLRAWNKWEGAPDAPVEFTTVRELPFGGERTYTVRFQPLDWAAFLGWFVSEGCVYKEKRENGRHRIVISQNPGPKRDAIEALLSKMELAWRPCAGHGKQIEFTHKALGLYLIRECGSGAHLKRIPECIREGSTATITAFLDTFCQGDGTQRADGNGRTYVTSSRQLADDLQEVLCKIGRAGGLYIKNKAGSSFVIDGRIAVRQHDTYVVYERIDKNRGELMRDKYLQKSSVKRIPYSGRVWCITTPYETFVARRKGVPMWSGNTTLCPRQGLAWRKPVEMRAARTSEIAARIITACNKWQPDHPVSVRVLIDQTGGWGQGTVDQLLVAGYSPMDLVYSTPSPEPEYYNLRSYMHFKLAEHVRAGCSIPDLPETKTLRAELTAALYTLREGKLWVIDKDVIKQKLGYSPDLADGFAQTYAIPDMPMRSRELVRQAQHALTDFDPIDPPEDWRRERERYDRIYEEEI